MGFEIVHEPEDLVAPALIVSFEDWVDAAGAGTTAARHIAKGGEPIAGFDADLLYDYRSHRPALDIIDGVPQQLEWPALTLTWRHLAERDLLILTGPEPDYRWKEFGDDVLELALRFGAVQHVSLGSIPTAVPHTAPTPVMMTASTKELLTGDPPNEGLLRVPAAAVSVIERTMADSGIPSVGFWAQVPHYANPYAAGAIALIRRVETHLDVSIGAGELEAEVAAQRQALNQVFAANPDASAYLERLESLIGEEPIPPAENIGAEVERFLRSQRRGEGGSNPFAPET